MRLISLALFLSSGVLFGQQPAPAPPSLTDQQILAIFSGIAQHESRIEPMLDQVRPQDWVAKGASDTYLAQFTSVREQLHAIETDMTNLAQHPDRMSEGMRALFRAEAFHRLLGSLMGGLRKYQNPALADLIEAVAAEDRADLNLLEQYVLELAVEKESQFAVVDREAQRCRATLSREPAPSARPARRPN